MYQGKYDKKIKQAAEPAPVKKSSSPPLKRSRGPRLSGVIFYAVFFLCIFLFYAATYFGLLGLRNWLTHYEMAQPATKSKEVFEKLFSAPDWGALYDTAGIQDTAYESNQAIEADIAKYFLRGSDAYKAITNTERGFVQNAASRDFANESVTDYCRYSDNLFSLRVSVTLNQHRASGSVKESNIDQSLFFEKQSSGKWLCYAMTAVDVSKPVQRVRLTFQDGDTTLESNFYDADSTQIICPVVSAPKGKVFSGWMTEEIDESGNPVMNLVFQPNESGNVSLPVGKTLEPMTLYPLFE